MTDYSELLEQLDYLGPGERACEDAAEVIRALQDQVKEYDNAIQRFLDGYYQHPRSYRPDQCPHEKYYYEDCGECDSEYWELEQARIKAMGVKGD
ncbi:MAG: hypothetical protein O7D95_03055 [Betaproteobacteria bacterium]|nr:hypothetical protein [Betaproteobacteria bacterium]